MVYLCIILILMMFWLANIDVSLTLLTLHAKLCLEFLQNFNVLASDTVTWTIISLRIKEQPKKLAALKFCTSLSDPTFHCPLQHRR